MRKGAFFMLDCLGFKGLWKKTEDPEILLKMLRDIEQSKEQIVAESSIGRLNINDRITVQLAFLSDTVVGGVSFADNVRQDGSADVNNGMLVFVASQIADAIASRFRAGRIPMVVRGCVVSGEFTVDQNFILGPAVDEAAEVANLAEGAFIWLSPQACRNCRLFVSDMQAELRKKPRTMGDSLSVFVGSFPDSAAIVSRLNSEDEKALRHILDGVAEKIMEGDTFVWDYPVPMKQSLSIRTGVLNPVSHSSNTEQMDETIGAFMSTMESDDLKVTFKRQNTETFLQRARAVTAEHISFIDSRGHQVAQFLAARKANG